MILNDKNNIKAVCFGEILFDVFGSEKKIGGAPLNLALRMSSLGFSTAIISAVGNDEDGEVLKNYASENGVNSTTIVTTPNYDTGVVLVHIDDRGSAKYDIKFPSAWDFIESNETITKTVSEANVFFFGSLVCRNDISKNTLYSLLSLNKKAYKVFDVNLRPPHYNMQVIQDLMDVSDFIKFNDEEILEISSKLGFNSQSLEDNINFISEKTSTKSICVTRGKHGSVMLWKGDFYYSDGFKVNVVDTVGAGDSFLAALLSGLLSEKTPQESLDLASAIGAIVATHKGANPKISDEEIENLLSLRKKA